MSNYFLVIVAMLAWWAWANRAVLALYARLPRVTAPAATAEKANGEWQAAWVQTLLRLQSELEQDGQADAVTLTRELVWRLIGGDPRPKA